MKSYLADLVQAAPTPAHGRNVAREYLQARILGAMQRAGAMIPLAFHGGTALRFLYAVPRYSEDLDFALERAREQYDFRQLQHHDRASLLAGKLRALLQRPWTKGRDLYDLLWYLSDPTWPEPNLAMLNNALGQTGWSGPELTAESWRTILRDQLGRLNWERAADDVRPLLESSADPDLLTLENVRRVLDSKRLGSSSLGRA